MVKAGWDVKSEFGNYNDSEVFDCMVAEFLLVEGRSIPRLETTLLSYKANNLNELMEKQQIKLQALPKLLSLFSTIEMPLIPVLKQMETTGILFDVPALQVVAKEITDAIVETENVIKKDVGFEINLNSSIQLGNFLAEKMGVPLSKTKTGRYATGENEIAQYAPMYPLIEHILAYRELTKLRSTYVDSLSSKVDEKGRIHTTYSQVAANTGRLSSSNPNLQNIPVTSQFGQKIKSCFVSAPGKTLISFDYSQQELRILAHLANETTLIQTFQQKKDVHTTTASLLFNVDYGSVTKEQRMVAKTINFGIIYGMSSYGMSSQLHIPVEEAQQFIDRFYTTYPHIKTYYDNYLRQGRIDGYVETLLGRRRYVFEYPNQKFIDNTMRRVLINFPIQGTAADLMKMAMIKIHNEIVVNNSSVNLLLQIHDDLVFEVEDDQKIVDTLVQNVRSIMCSIYPLTVPIEVDVKKGKRWGEMQKIEEKP